jgi:general secretion pathway protein N
VSGSVRTDRQWHRAQRAGRRWGLWGALLGAAAGLVFGAPADWLARAVQQASDGRLLLADASGTVWTGSAVVVLTGGAGSQDASALPGRLHWQLRPTWQGLTIAARQGCCINGDWAVELRPGWGRAELRLPARPEGVGQWPASWLTGLGTPWNTLRLGGVLRLSTPGLDVTWSGGQAQLGGSLDLDMLGASSRLSPLATLGSYRLSLRAAAGGATPVSLQLSTLEGALQLTGSGQWTGTQWRFRGEARAGEGQESALANLLNIIGRRQGALSVISIG